MTTFDLTSLLNKGIEYPTTEETVYTDISSLYEFGILEERIASTLDPDEIEKLHAQQAEYRQKVLDSALTISMRGLPRSIVNAIVKHRTATEKDEATRNDAITDDILTRSITGIVNAQGAAADGFTDAELSAFLGSLTQDAHQKLVVAVNRLEFDSQRNESQLTDPSFS